MFTSILFHFEYAALCHPVCLRIIINNSVAWNVKHFYTILTKRYSQSNVRSFKQSYIKYNVYYHDIVMQI